MFGWLRRKAPPPPESLWTVTVDDARISVRDPDGTVNSVSRAALSAIIIETNGSGPWGIDLWWLMFGDDGELACAVPGGATGETILADFASALPGFSHAQRAEALRSTANARFSLWRKAGDAAGAWVCLGDGPMHLADVEEVGRNPNRGGSEVAVHRCRTCGQLYRWLRFELNDWSGAGDYSDESVSWQVLDTDEVAAVLEDFNYTPRSERRHRIDSGWRRDG